MPLRPSILFAPAALLLLAGVPHAAAETGHRHGHARPAEPPAVRGAPYTGQQARKIKSLSAEEIAALKRGDGMGFAKPAELNGLPGPAHILELKDELALSTRQRQRVEALHADMRRRAVAAGERLIVLETAIDRAIARRHPDREEIGSLLARAAATRAQLRFIHLSAHLDTPAILTAAQVARYNVLRGYRPAPR